MRFWKWGYRCSFHQFAVHGDLFQKTLGIPSSKVCGVAIFCLLCTFLIDCSFARIFEKGDFGSCFFLPPLFLWWCYFVNTTWSSAWPWTWSRTWPWTWPGTWSQAWPWTWPWTPSPTSSPYLRLCLPKPVSGTPFLPGIPLLPNPNFLLAPPPGSRQTAL